ncbi:hypothetical protein [Salana multivorans]
MTHDAQWQPVPGDEIKEMLDRTGLGPADRDGVLTEATRVLTRCAAPTWGEAASSAELVVGEVQSGKTMSFTALTALARDNGFPLIVILAGTKNNLREQTLERLKRDLAMTGHGGLPAWAPIDNPGTSSISEVASRIEKLEVEQGRSLPTHPRDDGRSRAQANNTTASGDRLSRWPHRAMRSVPCPRDRRRRRPGWSQRGLED